MIHVQPTIALGITGHVAGVSLIELLVALAISSLLIAGAVTLYSQSRSTYQANTSIARLQEQGRYVLSALELDIELAGFYGFTNAADGIQLVTSGDPGRVVATASRMRQTAIRESESPPAPVANLPPGAHACGINFAVDVLTPIQGSNGAFVLGPSRDPGECKPYGSGARAEADTLTVRYADPRDATPEAGRIQIYASRLRSRTSHLLFADGNVPGVENSDNRTHNLIVRTYYISRDSVGRADFPALRMKTLSSTAGRAVFAEDEVMAGVEDLQVQFGIDTGDYNNDGFVDSEADVNKDGIPETNGRATRYVNPDFPDLGRYQVVSVRVWIRLRSEFPEPGFTDETYRYADIIFTPSGAERGFRRVVMSRTFYVRNARRL